MYLSIFINIYIPYIIIDRYREIDDKERERKVDNTYNIYKRLT